MLPTYDDVLCIFIFGMAIGRRQAKHYQQGKPVSLLNNKIFGVKTEIGLFHNLLPSIIANATECQQVMNNLQDNDLLQVNQIQKNENLSSVPSRSVGVSVGSSRIVGTSHPIHG